MAYQFADTFDHYTDPALMYESVSGSPVISSAYARFPAVAGFPNQGMKIPSYAYVRKNLKSQQASLIDFFSYGGPLPSSAWYPIRAYWDSVGGSIQCVIAINSAGGLSVVTWPYSGGLSTQTIVASSANGLLSATTIPSHGIEDQITISRTVGSVKIWLDGAVILNVTGINTQATGNPWVDQVSLGYGYGPGTDMYSDYQRIWDTTGSYQNAPLGYDVRKLTKLPTGAGALTQWSANGAAANWQCVDDNPPDGDTTYVSSTASGTYDSYAMGTSGFTGTPSMVVAKSYVRKDDANTRAIEVGVRSGSSNSLGSPYTLGSTYVFVDACISLDPATGAPPTAAAADAYQHLKEEST